MEEKKTKKAAEKVERPSKLHVRYKGPKASVPVHFPIGAKSLGAIHTTQSFASGSPVEMNEDDAHKLVAIDPVNFEFAQKEGEEPIVCRYSKEDVIPSARRRPAGEAEPKMALPDGVRAYTPKGKQA